MRELGPPALTTFPTAVAEPVRMANDPRFGRYGAGAHRTVGRRVHSPLRGVFTWISELSLGISIRRTLFTLVARAS